MAGVVAGEGEGEEGRRRRRRYPRQSTGTRIGSGFHFISFESPGVRGLSVASHFGGVEPEGAERSLWAEGNAESTP